MYLNFNLRERNGIFFPYENSLSIYADNNFDISIEVNESNCPAIIAETKIFFGEVSTRELLTGKFEQKLIEGWNNYPLFLFNPEKYENGEFPLEPFDYTKEEYFYHYERRLEIKHSIRQSRVDPEIEFKAIRKLLSILIKLHPELENTEEFEYFARYNETVEREIAARPKSKQYFDSIDIKKRNGIISEDNDGTTKE